MRGHYPRISRFTTNLHSPQKRPRKSANALLGMWLIIYFEVVIRICKSLIKFRVSFENTMQRYTILSRIYRGFAEKYKNLLLFCMIPFKSEVIL